MQSPGHRVWSMLKRNGQPIDRQLSPFWLGAGDGVGIGAGEVHSPPAREPERLKARNYRITSADRLGAGSLKQKAQDNFAAIELVQRLTGEVRAATNDERRMLVKYVGWGGIPQVFADFGPEEWQPEPARHNTTYHAGTI